MEDNRLVETPGKQSNLKQIIWCVQTYIKSNKIGQLRARFLQEVQAIKAPEKYSTRDTHCGVKKS